ncbi:MAG: hypothetical protein ABIA37_04105 [Candidatus Woesearchaeota archaeon]
MKSAASIIMLIFEVMVVVLVVFMTLEVAKGMGEAETVRKINLANDMKMMVDTLIGVPGSAVVEYPQNVSDYIFVLNQDNVVVYKEGDADVLKVTREFYLPTEIKATGALNQKARLCLEKNSLTIILRECKQNEQ